MSTTLSANLADSNPHCPPLWRTALSANLTLLSANLTLLSANLTLLSAKLADVPVIKYP